VRYNDPTGHMCSDPEDESNPYCDGADTVGERTLDGGGRGLIKTCTVPSSSGTVFWGQSHPVGSITSLSDYAEDTFSETSFGAELFEPIIPIAAMGAQESAIYAGSWLSLKVDQMSMWAPHYYPNNVFLSVDWVYYEESFSIPAIHLLNYSDSWARIVQVVVQPSYNPYYESISYGPSTSVGTHGGEPGIIDYPLSTQEYLRSESFELSIWVKVAHAPFAIGNTVLIPGTGLQPGISEPMQWFEPLP
jgi:hypothetical protein